MTNFDRRVTRLLSNKKTKGKPDDQTNSAELIVEEKVLLYFLMNQVLRKQFEVVDNVI